MLRLPTLVSRQFPRGSHWAETEERGDVLGMQSMLAIYQLFSRRAFTLFLYPVVACVWLTAANARRASQDYLEAIRSRARQLGVSVPRVNSFSHVLEFG